MFLDLLDGVDGFLKTVTDIKNFGKIEIADVHVEPIPDGEPCVLLKEDNFTVALKMHLNFEENFKV